MKMKYLTIVSLLIASILGAGFTLFAQEPSDTLKKRPDLNAPRHNEIKRLKIGPKTAPGDLKPLSEQDKNRVDGLLRNFDTNSYDIRFKTVDPKGVVTSVQKGGAIGLANIRQSATVRGPGDVRGAGTTNTINIFKQAGTTNTINVFKPQVGTTNTINVFKDAAQQSKAQELNAILAKYSQ